MDARAIGLAVASGVATVALVSAAWLGKELIESRATVKDLQTTVSKLDKARNEDDAATIDLCPQHHRALEAVVDIVAGVNSHGSQRVFDRDTARAVLVLAVRHWGHALASIPVREEA